MTLSELHCPDGLKKSDLPGFYDPVTGLENFLEIIYMFKENYHYVVVAEFEEVHLPLEGLCATCVLKLTGQPIVCQKRSFRINILAQDNVASELLHGFSSQNERHKRHQR
jgi:hypothetical protein